MVVMRKCACGGISQFSVIVVNIICRGVVNVCGSVGDGDDKLIYTQINVSSDIKRTGVVVVDDQISKQ